MHDSPGPGADRRWTRIRVPASSANLGPGFDALGLALGVYLEVRFRAADWLQIRAEGRDAAMISTASDNLIWQTAQDVAATLARALPPVELEIRNDIPLGKGLGSSAAALTAGVVLADQLLALDWTPLRILDEAARIEGHPDNVAACVLGSIVTSAIDTCGTARAIRLELSPKFGIAVVVPDFILPTSKARTVLPDSYRRADAVFNVQRSALLISALTTGATWAFPAALEDRMHQPYRYPLVPGLEEMVRLRAPGLLGCALSGAGPSVLVFFEKGHESVCEQFRGIFSKHGHASEILSAPIPHAGFEVMSS
jgi:homoserine kinase